MTTNNDDKYADVTKRNLLHGFFFLGILLILSLFLETVGIPLCARASAQETNATEIQGVVESVGVFKNGVAAIVERFQLPGVGEYVVSTAPQPLHGTFFLESDAVLEASADVGDVELDLADVSDFDWTRDLQGRWFHAVLPGESEPRKVRVPFVSRKNDGVNSELVLRSSYMPIGGLRGGVFLETESNETIWLANPAEITKITLDAASVPDKVVRKKSRLLVKVKSVPDGKDAVVRVSYLTKGLCWAPQYRVNLKDEKTLELEQNGLLINEWRDFSTPNLTLFSGFPRILFKDALSPIDPTVTLAAYFASLSGRNNGDSFRREVVTQQAVLNNAIGGFDAPDAPSYNIQEGVENYGGVDVYATPVGNKAFAKNERGFFMIARKDVAYKRVVCWNIADGRDVNGNLNPANVNSATEQFASYYGQTTRGESALAHTNRFVEPWDVLEFRNPFNGPITTGPATTTASNGSFLGQDMFYWTNPGELTLLPITKSLSVKVRSVENERDLTQTLNDFAPAQVDPRNFADFNWTSNEENWGRFFTFRGINYRIAVYDAEITLSNTRKEQVEMRVSRQYTGLALKKSFEGFEPDISQIGYENSWERFVNMRCELKWTTVLEPNETRVIKFTYLRLIHQ